MADPEKGIMGTIEAMVKGAMPDIVAKFNIEQIRDHIRNQVQAALLSQVADSVQSSMEEAMANFDWSAMKNKISEAADKHLEEPEIRKRLLRDVHDEFMRRRDNRDTFEEILKKILEDDEFQTSLARGAVSKVRAEAKELGDEIVRDALARIKEEHPMIVSSLESLQRAREDLDQRLREVETTVRQHEYKLNPDKR